MYRRSKMLLMTTALLASAIALPTVSHAQTAKDLVGAWTLVSNTNVRPDGSRIDAFGPNPKGMVVFTADGHFVITLIRSDLPRFKSNSRAEGTPEENQAIVRGTLTTFGTYSMAGKVMTQKIEASTWPVWTGTAKARGRLLHGRRTQMDRCGRHDWRTGRVGLEAREVTAG